jgi:elongator complex protein 1
MVSSKIPQLSLADTSAEYGVPGDTPEADERCRSIERGAKLVTVIPSIYAVILQMPRGNLETIYPRALVLAGIRQHLDEKDFKSAFLACENHQVDMNIIYDYRPDLFMSNITLFVDQVRKVSRIDLFLSKLSEEDVSKTLYKDTLVRSVNIDASREKSASQSNGMANGTENHVSPNSKVNRVCDAFLSCLKPKISKHLRNIITAHVCKRPPDLVSALELVASLRRTDATKAEEAVSHLCFLSDVNRLYDTALSLYDLPLTLLVAQQAQRDPREYMPFLQTLNALPQFRRNFSIDNHLGNYAKALTSLHALAAHEEAEAYTIKHALYPQAVKMYRYDSEHLTTITRLHATYLTLQSNHLAAAFASESLSDYDLASSSYAKCSPPRWREALHCVTMIQPSLPPTQIQSMALQLANTLAEEQRDYRSASQIHIDYLHNIPTAARLLCRGSYFAESLRLLSLHNLAAQIPDIIDTSLAEKSGEITELIADCCSQLHAQVSRIKELRIKKAEDPLAFFGGDPSVGDGEGEGVDLSDNISLAPTDASTAGGASLFTRYTGNKTSRFAGTVLSNNTRISRKTSKTRRREERKRARGKKGSVYEEEYLVGSVRRLIERVNGVHAEVKRLVEGLARRGMRERKEVIEERMGVVAGDCEWAKVEVWGSGDGEEDGDGAGGEGENTAETYAEHESKPRGADAVFWDSQIEMQQQGRKEAPNVTPWKGSEY